jgi:uncharacterized membrane protein
MKIWRRVFAATSIAWAAALPLATLAASRPVASTAPYLFALVVYLVGSLVCHQRPERSFYLWAHQMPVCARCTGIYAGAALTVLFTRLRVTGSSRVIALLAASPAIATLVYEWTTGVTPSNWIRAASGLCLGAGVAVLVQRELH